LTGSPISRATSLLNKTFYDLLSEIILNLNYQIDSKSLEIPFHQNYEKFEGNLKNITGYIILAKDEKISYLY